MSQDAPNYQQDNRLPTGARIAIVAARFNPELIEGLMERTIQRLGELGAAPGSVEVRRVPGSAELPLACKKLALTGAYTAVIALGVLIRGETQHHDIISRTVSAGLQEVSLETLIPAINGVISAESWQQAHDRTIGSIERGREFAEAAVEMAIWKV